MCGVSFGDSEHLNPSALNGVLIADKIHLIEVVEPEEGARVREARARDRDQGRSPKADDGLYAAIEVVNRLEGNIGSVASPKLFPVVLSYEDFIARRCKPFSDTGHSGLCAALRASL